ncbi:hypothetical protein Tco_0862629 [Tanacetum coccineum]
MMVVQDQADMGEGLTIPTDPHHTPTIIESSSQPQKKHKPRKPKKKDTQGRQDTIGDTIAQTGFENVSKTSNDSLLARVNTPRSDEDSMKLKELMDFCTKLKQSVLDMENTKTVQAQEITSLKLRVKKLEKKGGSRTHKLKRLYKVGLSRRVESTNEASLGDQEDASKQGRKIDDIDKDVEVTLVDETQGRYMAEKEIHVAEKEVSTADPVTTTGEIVTTASVEIKSAKPEVKGVVIGEQSECTIRTRPQQLPSKDKGKGIMVEPEKPTKKKDQIRLHEELAFRLQAKEEEEVRLTREKAEKEQEANVALIKEWNDIQEKIEAD